MENVFVNYEEQWSVGFLMLNKIAHFKLVIEKQ
jgi:hypothetical protein